MIYILLFSFLQTNNQVEHTYFHSLNNNNDTKWRQISIWLKANNIQMDILIILKPIIYLLYLLRTLLLACLFDIACILL